MPLRKADFAAGIGFTVFGLLVLLATLNFQWDLPAIQQAGWHTAPGLIPASAAVLLMLQGIFLSVHALRHGGGWRREDWRRLKQSVSSPEARRAWLMALLLAVYVYGLVGRVHFILASFLFLAVFMFLFKAGRWWMILLISAGASSGIGLLFQYAARIPLP
jgi:hypothetical protein